MRLILGDVQGTTQRKGNPMAAFCLVEDGAMDKVLAHEFGHILGLADLKGKNVVPTNLMSHGDPGTTLDKKQVDGAVDYAVKVLKALAP